MEGREELYDCALEGFDVSDSRLVCVVPLLPFDVVPVELVLGRMGKTEVMMLSELHYVYSSFCIQSFNTSIPLPLPLPPAPPPFDFHVQMNPAPDRPLTQELPVAAAVLPRGSIAGEDACRLPHGKPVFVNRRTTST